MRVEINDLQFDLDERDTNPERKSDVQQALLQRFALSARSFDFAFYRMDRKHEWFRVQFDAKQGVSLEDIRAWLEASGFTGFDVYAVNW
ncbi:hypothetical protein [Delftia acidovorans]|uniref:hypothetical protein n=1 Tax=Delftia acidovorans TaxID=80866 RepID=UPI00301898B0